MLTYASAFAGIEGFGLGFDDSGMTPTIQIEANTHCQKVLAERYPTVPKAGDIRDVSGTDLGSPDVFAGGFPCQDTSIAAPHRRGLEGDRSGLYYEFIRLLDEHLRLVDAAKPEWTIIENPVGLLKSHDGRDMAAVVRGLENLGYGWAYRVVDGRYVGSAQRRERVLIVGHRSGDCARAWSVLGDDGAGGEAPAPDRVLRSGRPAPHLSVADDQGPLIFRKSARAGASITKGGYETWVPSEHSNTLTGFDGGGPLRQTHLIVTDRGVRSLTFTEWERLQGFPDGWTDPIVSDAARWTALGNAMNVHMARWLGRRLVAATSPVCLPATLR